MGVSENDAKVHFIDYGSLNVAKFTDIVPMPLSLLDACCSHSVEIRLASGRSIKEIDAEGTQTKLIQVNEFFATIEKMPNERYAMVISDSLVHFKR